ncbi:YidB family protein [Brevundimonas aveniformis]|uniref:YidB family protein n=1 Tax=Brevundimonas aveniformis TaxID=370977 RepID=UPI0004137EDF|nr:YidB family protein [Brevundimonas aveniformis]
MNIMDMIGGALGGVGTGGSTNYGQLFQIVQSMGGIDAVMDQLRSGGLNDEIGSWIAQGANQVITPDRVRAILGDGMIGHAAQQMGLSPEQISEIISQQLPHVIDMMTPDGNSPGGGFGDILGQVLGGRR